MRVAVHHPSRTEPDGTAVEASVSAYRMGRIDDFVNPVTGETTPRDAVAAKLLADAKLEYPGCEVVIERLVDNGDDTSAWVHVDSVPAGASGPEGSLIAAPELGVEQSQTTTPEATA